MRAFRDIRRRFWLEAAFVVLCAAVWLATRVWPDWIELVFHVDPDESDGSLERAVTVLLPLVGLLVAIVAGREWRRPRLVAGGART